MLNFFPSPIECLIYRANNKPTEVKVVSDLKEDIEEKNESSRKILNELSHNSNIVNSPTRKDLMKYNNPEKQENDLKSNKKNDKFANKKEVEIQMRNFENSKKDIIK